MLPDVALNLVLVPNPVSLGFCLAEIDFFINGCWACSTSFSFYESESESSGFLCKVFFSKSFKSLSNTLIAFNYDMVLLWILVVYILDLNMLSLSCWTFLTAILAAHFYTFDCYQSFLNWADFLIFYNCFSLNFIWPNNLAWASFFY